MTFNKYYHIWQDSEKLSRFVGKVNVEVNFFYIYKRLKVHIYHALSSDYTVVNLVNC